MQIEQVKNWLASPRRWPRLRDQVFSTLFFRLPVGLRRRLYQGQAFTCPVCETNLRAFLSLRRPYYLECPVCRSMQRHRLVLRFLQTRTSLFAGGSPRFLHIAPEPGLARRLRAIPAIDYLSADLNDPRAMRKIDLTRIDLPSASLDAVYCSHVLEHIPADRQALAEIYRVLAPGGWALILVPIQREITYEDPAIVLPQQREKAFGQFDHVRVYGRDFDTRLRAAGFEVRALSASDLCSPAETLRLGLSSQDTLFFCCKPETALK
jgi:SAM-dependent methyltransferase